MQKSGFKKTLTRKRCVDCIMRQDLAIDAVSGDGGDGANHVAAAKKQWKGQASMIASMTASI